jgi:hypothetical protein
MKKQKLLLKTPIIKKPDDKLIKENKEDIKNSDKYKITLKLINIILVNLGKDETEDFTDFKNIDRVDILKDDHKEQFDEISEEIYKLFTKIKCGYYKKKDNIIYNSLKYMCKDLGYKLQSKNKSIQKNKINNTYILYSIVLK